jgi:hypothetical protein
VIYHRNNCIKTQIHKNVHGSIFVQIYYKYAQSFYIIGITGFLSVLMLVLWVCHGAIIDKFHLTCFLFKKNDSQQNNCKNMKRKFKC